MKSKDKEQASRRHHKNLTFCDERTELLNTIKDIVKTEVDERMDHITLVEHDPHPENPPPLWERIYNFMHGLLP